MKTLNAVVAHAHSIDAMSVFLFLEIRDTGIKRIQTEHKEKLLGHMNTRPVMTIHHITSHDYATSASLLLARLLGFLVHGGHARDAIAGGLVLCGEAFGFGLWLGWRWWRC